ncbi:PREDICTED: ATP-dependent RNA helicase DDX51 [Ceratosolen solmsi marchali]|uniref:ATP-dependent RNA helicase n=1 Tax=Ceratosolen solmsi marchali TaxID=326594 RepID=A0AAJ6YIZ1_9HYME|nr:PREDICTED: ATP-dependent RNA helicase DDX51 [Ceratosolen solmsi marchali]
MSLFGINRYEDEEWKKETNSSHNHLSNFLKQIEVRRRQRDSLKAANESTAEDVPEKVNHDISENRDNEKKSKKRKHEALSDKASSDNEVDEQKTCVEFEKDSSKRAEENFTILGSGKHFKRQLAKRVLPRWLTHPEIVASNLNSGSALKEVESLLDDKLLAKLKEDRFTKLFPVQVHLLSWLLKCDKDYNAGKWVQDTCVCMPTGSGKTLAYVLPIIQVLQKNFVRTVRCLIVLPVQELATQVHEVVMKYANCTSLKVALITGATSFKEEQETLVQKHERGSFISMVDIIVATPGRLIDHIRKTSGFSLTNLRFLVIDEADCAVDWLQYIPFPHSKAPPPSIKNIRSSWNKPAQKILLSATLSQDPEKLNRLGLFRPILFTSVVIDFEIDNDLNLDEHCKNIARCYGNPSELTERIVQCLPQYKPLALYRLLVQTQDVEKTLVFTNSSESAHRLAILLQSLLKSKNISVGELSAQLGSKQREETLEKFIRGASRVLVSSDALARGLDIPDVKLVVSYDLPKYIKGYIHRAGRTGRGGLPGTAVSLLLPNQVDLFTKMLKKVGRTIPIGKLENLDDLAESINYESHLENLKDLLANEQGENLRRLKSRKSIVKS